MAFLIEVVVQEKGVFSEDEFALLLFLRLICRLKIWIFMLNFRFNHGDVLKWRGRCPVQWNLL